MVADAGEREANKRRFELSDPRDRAEDLAFRGSFSGYETNAFFVGGAAGAPYVEAAVPLGLGSRADGRAVATLDFDDDGDLDLAMLGLQGIQLLENIGAPPTHKALSLTLKARRGHAAALGARVYVRVGDRTVMDRVRLTDGFHTQSLPRLHFGLGKNAVAKSVEVRWPSGRRERFGTLAAGHWRLEEGKGRARSVPRRPWPVATRPQAALNYALDVPTQTIGGTEVALRADEEKALVVNFWGPSCEACARELPMLSALAQARPEVGFVAVSVETEDPRAVRRYAAEKGLMMPIRLATDDAIRAFFADPTAITLPTTFVFGADGRLRRRFTREVDQAAIVATLADTPSSPEDYDTLSTFSRGNGIVELEKAIELAPDDAFRYDQLAQLAGNQGFMAKAAAAARKAVTLRPGYGPYWRRFDLTMRLAGKTDALEAIYADAPETATILALRARLREDVKNWAEALDFFERAAAKKPRSITALRQVLRLQKKLRLEDEATKTNARIGALERENRAKTQR